MHPLYSLHFKTYVFKIIKNNFTGKSEMKILFYGDECRELWGLLPVIKLIKDNHQVAFGSIDSRAIALAQRNNTPITNPFETYHDLLVVNKMHYGVARDLSEAYAQAGKPVVLIEHAWDGLIHLIDQLWGKQINFFTAFAASGKQQYELLREKHGDRIRITGFPRLDKLIEAPQWDKQEIYDALGVNEFWLVTIPPQNHSTPEADRKLFEDLPRLLDARPVYKIHPRYSTEPYLKYGQLIIGDDTLTQDITYEILNAAKGIVTHIPPSFMFVEASILKKPVICFGNLVHFRDIVPELGFINEIRKFDIDKLSSTPDNYRFNKYQQELIDMFPHNGRNSERVVHLIEEILKNNR